jgi:hypothetical protein
MGKSNPNPNRSNLMGKSNPNPNRGGKEIWENKN